MTGSLAPEAAIAKIEEAGVAYPVLLRETGTHTGNTFVKAHGRREALDYLAKTSAESVYAIQYHDCAIRGRYFRKMRVFCIDGELYPSQLEKAKRILRGVEWIDVSDILIEMRQVKTPEELALWRRSYVHFDRAHAFARDYILTHGTDVTDYEVGMATELWINDQLYSDLDLADGAPHHGVRSGIGIGVRVGPLTGYPHPNQPRFNKIGRNRALQVAGGSRIGGYGGENYRAFVIGDPVDDSGGGGGGDAGSDTGSGVPGGRGIGSNRGRGTGFSNRNRQTQPQPEQEFDDPTEELEYYTGDFGRFLINGLEKRRTNPEAFYGLALKNIDLNKTFNSDSGGGSSAAQPSPDPAGGGDFALAGQGDDDDLDLIAIKIKMKNLVMRQNQHR